MVCRCLRSSSWWGVFPSLGVCLALVGGMAILPPAWLEDDIPSLTPLAHTVPLTAIAEHLGIRIEKQTQPHRPFLKKPERGARLSAAERVASSRPRTLTPRAFRSLPRRHLYAPRSRPSSPDAPSHPLLS